MTRRRVIAGVPLTLGLATLGRIGWAADERGDPTAPPLSDAQFLALSQQLTGHDDLNALTATRLSAALARGDRGLFNRISGMALLASPGQSSTDLLANIRTQNLDDAAMALTAAWYTGTVGQGAKAEVVAYAEALMYRPVRDAMSPPTYCLGGPAWWVEPPPPIGVASPAPPAAGRL